MQEITNQLLTLADSSFKYILIVFNFMTLIVVYIHKSKQKHKKQHHVLFVTAHPDDEVMFFRPSLSSITKDYFVHLLCFTGKETQRQIQLKNSTQKLNIHKLQCLNNQKFKDSMQCSWPKQSIQQIVLKYVEDNNIKAVFTFDDYGVSGHLNHKSISQALAELHYPAKDLKVLNKKSESLKQEQKNQVQKIKKNSIKIYHLKSVNLIRKYSGFLQVIFTLVRDFSWINLNFIDGYKSMSIHKSQFTWYRKLWVFFSQYSYINVFTMTRMIINNATKSQTNSNNKIEKCEEPIKQQEKQIQLKKQK